MANKVVQLINEDNDNLYPLSGGVLSDSITTDMLKDSSVTSDKIDWTTMDYTTTEKVAYYLNGTPVYRKYLEVTHTVATAGQLHDHGISNLSKVVNITGWASAAGQHQQLAQRVVPDNISTYGVGIGDISANQFGTFLGTGVGRPCSFGLIFDYTKNS